VSDCEELVVLRAFFKTKWHKSGANEDLLKFIIM